MKSHFLFIWSAMALSPCVSHAQGILAEGVKPSVFLQQGVSSPNNEATPTFSPDGKTLYLQDNANIYVSHWEGGQWTKPAPVSFTGQYKDWDPVLTQDGKRLIFVSNRPWAGAENNPKRGNHLWYSRLEGDQWSEPQRLDSPVNEWGYSDFAPSISAKGTLCFCSRNRDGHPGMRGYCARWSGEHYEQPELLTLNGNDEIYDPYISPDERYIIFASDSCLYISYRSGEGWTQGQKLGPTVNDGTGSLWGASISRDGKTMYYSSSAVNGILMIPVRI